MAGKNGNSAKSDWIIDLNEIKAKELAAFQEVFNQLTTGGQLEPFWPWAARIIKAWPYNLDPSQVENYGELGMLDLREVVSHLANSFRLYAEGTSPVRESGDSGNEGRAAGSSEGTG